MEKQVSLVLTYLVLLLLMCLAANAQAGGKIYLPSADHIHYDEDGFNDVYTMGFGNLTDRCLVGTYADPGKMLVISSAGHTVDLVNTLPDAGAVHTRGPIEDAAGNFVMPVSQTAEISRFQSDGTFINSWVCAATPTFIAEDDGGNIWASLGGPTGQSLVQYDTSGAVLQTISNAAGMPQRATLDFIGGLHMYDGYMYVADGGRMLKFDPADPNTMTEAIAGMDYWGGNFWEVAGIDITPDGKIYVVENVNDTVKIYDATLPANANYIQTISDPLLDEAMSGIGVDPCGTVYVGENGAWPNIMKFEVDEDDDDADGVGNSADLCPNTPMGTEVDPEGCPVDDVDGDGVPDYRDLCIDADANYPVNGDGCIDTDEDGITDADDDCPGTPLGTWVDEDGCPVPDTDGDGVFDPCDDCPGSNPLCIISVRGCPDCDGDGIYEPDDLCEDTDANDPVNSDGCIDTDEDGITDADDLCPDTDPGANVNADGCEDTDGDGIEDACDLCPDTPPHWPVDGDGCPLPISPAKAPRAYEYSTLVSYSVVQNIGTHSLAIAGSGDPCYMLIVGEDPSVGWHAFNLDTGDQIDENHDIEDLYGTPLWVGGIDTDPTNSDIIWIKGHPNPADNHWFIPHYGPTGPYPGQVLNFLQPAGEPGAIAIDGYGKIWSACQAPGAVRRYDPTAGAVLQIIPDTPGLPRENWHYNLGGIDVDLDTGWIYVADRDRVVRFDPCDPIGTMEHFAGDPNGLGSLPGQFGNDGGPAPGQVHVSEDGRVYVTDPNNARIQVFDRDRVWWQGNFIQVIEGPNDIPAANLNWWDSNTIKGVAVDPYGDVYVSDAGSGPQIHKFSTGAPGTCSRAIAAGYGLANDFDNDCYVGLGDLIIMSQAWLDCTLPGGSGCIQLSVSTAFPIAEAGGAMSVDALLGDWIDPCWMDLDVVYDGDPCDITSAKYAVQWHDVDNVVYVAAIVEDNQHDFESMPTDWDSSDRIEIYAQGDPNGDEMADGSTWGWGSWRTNPLGESALFDKAQQYAVGYTNTAPGWAWAIYGNGAYIPGNPEPTDPDFKAAARVSGSAITYEVAVPMYIWNGARSVADTDVRDLTLGAEVGLDVIAFTRWAPNDPCTAVAEYGMLSENDMTGKFDDADQFRRYILVTSLSDPLPCGAWGYFEQDLDNSCDVDLGDLDMLALSWLDCIEPDDAGCDHPWE